ncbi:MAG TPA: zinc-dependent metalloprotease [Actinomycetota bacterium]|nr:zinc-dependent metalloprotease [Actinomycetota bacterium]
MDGPPIEPTGIPRPAPDWWEQVPVLRELYRLLAEQGPVNWELARQIGVALGSEDEPDPGDLAEAQRELEGMSRAAQLECESFTELVTGAVAPVHAVTRRRWVEENISVFKLLMEPLANKLTAAALPADLPIALPPQAMQAMRQVGGLLMGLQSGFVLGYMAPHVVGQYELVLPDPSGGRLLYVVSNMRKVEQDWSLDPAQFRYWIALHEVVHHLQFSRTWTRNYFHAQIRAVIDSLDLDPTRLASAFEGFDISDPERMMDLLSDPERIMQAAWTPLGRDAVGRLQAFMTIAEGYATFVMDAVGARLLSDHARLREVMDRRKATNSPGEQLLERLLGIELKRRQYEDGLRFCRYVAGVRDIATLNRVWENPETLPTSEELAEPDSWISRVVG